MLMLNIRPLIYSSGTVEQPCAEGLHKCSSGQCVANSNDCPLETSEIQTTAAQSVTQPSGKVFSIEVLSFLNISFHL